MMASLYEKALEKFHDLMAESGSQFMNTLGQASKNSAGLLGGPLGVYATDIAKIKGKKEGEARRATPTNPELLKMYKPDGSSKADRMFTKEEMERSTDNAIRQLLSMQQEQGQGRTPVSSSGGSKGGSNVDHWKDRIDYLTEKLGLSRPAKGEAGKDFYEMIKGGDRTYSPYINGEGTESVATKFGSPAAVNLFNSLMTETGKEIPDVLKAVGYAENQLAEAETNRTLLPGRAETQQKMNAALPSPRAAGLEYANEGPKFIDVPQRTVKMPEPMEEGENLMRYNQRMKKKGYAGY
jgi:hypothetical protein